MSIGTYRIYNTPGRIVRTVTCPASMAAQQAQMGETLYAGSADEALHWIDGGIRKDRPEQQTTIDGTTLRTLPEPCTVHVNGEAVEVPDGTLELTFEVGGDYPVRVEAFPYQEWEGVIHAP